MRRMEDRIRRLCTQLLAVKDDEEIGPTATELRDALHQHIARLRKRFAGYPLMVERRVQSGIPPPDRPAREGAAKEPSSAASAAAPMAIATPEAPEQGPPTATSDE